MAIEHLTSKYALDYSSQRRGGLRYDDHCASLTCFYVVTFYPELH